MEELDLRELLAKFWDKKIHILLIILAFTVIGALYSYLVVKPEYKSTASIILIQSVITGTADGNVIQSNEVSNARLVATCEELIKRDFILDEVVKNLNNTNINVSGIKGKISVQAVKDSDLIDITVKNKNPKYAADIANETAKVFCEKIVEFYNLDSTQIFETANPSSRPYNINHIKDIVIFIFIGCVISVLYVLVLNMLDNTAK